MVFSDVCQSRPLATRQIAMQKYRGERFHYIRAQTVPLFTAGSLRSASLLSRATLGMAGEEATRRQAPMADSAPAGSGEVGGRIRVRIWAVETRKALLLQGINNGFFFWRSGSPTQACLMWRKAEFLQDFFFFLTSTCAAQPPWLVRVHWPAVV